MANSASSEQNHCSAINDSIPLMQGNLPTLTLSGKIRVTVTFCLFLLSTTFNASFLLKLQKWTQKKEKGKKLSRMKMLLKHLTLANLLETLIVMPLDGMWNITVQWYAGEFLCKVLSYLKLFSMYAPAFMMVVISLDRSLAITRPLTVQNNSKLERSMTSVAWILSSIFAGPQALTIHDTEKCRAWDLGTNFFLCEDDIVSGRNRAEAVLYHIAELNPYVHVTLSSVPFNETTDLSFLNKYQCVIVTEMKLTLQKKINEFCRSHYPPIKANPGIVTCLENHPHKLETGQFLTFREVNGMTGLNGSTQQITVVSPFSFSIGDTTELEPYLHGGIAVQVKTPKTFCFESLEKQIKHPKCLIADFSKPEVNKHFAGLKEAAKCQQDSEELLKLATSISETLEEKPEVNADIVHWLSWTARGFLSPLAAAVGGVASQEVLKAVTGKFSPLCQWLYLEAADIVESLGKPECEEFLPRGDRYDALRACIGDTLCQKLQNLNIFLVGCGAIGCEMLKNFALLGVATGKEKGMVTVTDPDLIEKSNLNRQFLFRPHHIQKPKSYTAADATMKINPQLKIDAHLNKVCPTTETIYNDEFYTKQDIIITALDNVEARRYVDSRCLASLRPLLDSGTMGTKGHTEVIIPHLTESYNSHRDPPEEEIPFCTLKSFPAAIEHTIQWARDKFESSFSHKPSLFNKFWQTYVSAEEVLQKIQSGQSLEGCFQVIKLLNRRPRNWSQCVELARLKFEKYFNHKDLSADALVNILSEVKIQEFKPSNKVVQTDETARKPDHVPISSEDERNAIFQLEKAISSNEATKSDLQMAVLSFEKDDDSNGHIDFITAASNLRAKMYSIEPADRFKTKRIAGKIIPAIATSTAAVSGLVALEMIKVTGGYPFEAYKNCFLNLAIPIIVFTETSEVRKTEIRNGISFTIWDRWTVHGKEDFTLLDFINAVKEKYGIEPTMVVQGVKMLYVPVMPGHAKRLKLTMHKLVKPSTEKKYVDLTVSFAPDTDGDEDLPGPPVRYYFSHDTD
ncbi:Ubiquitin-like modifier-activating enzyme 6 [Sciurus carolinensis]|uniref:E1 ubiquitin-activating enzyme n=1 Tax=Sciurus carolinensis TaxID=30640 RepID=A0AA41MH31_SCICA|nr:Ubiquitin-like modifier-activating enzyme 6 [Sciurus carolinensis]